jgi:hypothetical protein
VKNKPVIIAVVSLILLVSAFFVWDKLSDNANEVPIRALLTNFKAKLKDGNVDSLQLFFTDDAQVKNLKYFIKTLAGLGINGKPDPLFDVDLVVDSAKIEAIDFHDL